MPPHTRYEYNPSPHVEYWYSTNGRKLPKMRTTEQDVEVDGENDDDLPNLEKILTWFLQRTGISEEKAGGWGRGWWWGCR